MPFRVFVSCGQRTEQEREAGLAAASAVEDTPGFEPFFAQMVNSLEGVNSGVLGALMGCSGAIVILHERGQVVGPDGQVICRRSSVWVNQEIAILAYRNVAEHRELPILSFAEEGLLPEGISQYALMNPLPLGSSEYIEAEVREWLSKPHPWGKHSQQAERFQQLWSALGPADKAFLDGLWLHGWDHVNVALVKSHLREKGFGGPSNDDKAIAARLGKAGLIHQHGMEYDGHHVSLVSHWRNEVERALGVEKAAGERPAP